MANNIHKVTTGSGKVRWAARVKFSGGKEVQKTFDFKKDAERWKRSQEELKIKKTSKDLKLGETTFEQVFEFVCFLPVAHYSMSGRSCAPQWIAQIGKHRISSFNQVQADRLPLLIEQLQLKNGKFPAPSTVRKYYFSLKKALQVWARHSDYRLEIRWDQKLPGAWENPRDVRVSDEDLSKLIEAAKKQYVHQTDMCEVLLFLLNTGLRRQELFYARWTDISSSGQTLHIRRVNSKTDTDRHVPLNKCCQNILIRRSSDPNKGDRIFSNYTAIDNLSQQFVKTRKRAGLSHITLHDFRHEAIARYIENTSESHTKLMKIFGHVEMKTYLRYYNMRPDDFSSSVLETNFGPAI